MIQFGAAGWRGVIGDEFTFRNVRLVAQAIADVFRERRVTGTLVVGYDTRFLSERFAGEAARVLTQNGFPALRCSRDAPTPVVSLAVRRRHAVAGLTFTAGHSPPECNGLKLHEADGVAAQPATTEAVEGRVAGIRESFVDRYHGDQGLLRSFDPAPDYVARIRELVDVDAVARAGTRIAVDPLYGTGREYLDRVLIDAGCDCEVQHNFRDPYFGGYSPAADGDSLRSLRELVTARDCDVGLAVDGDADRFAVIDHEGTVLAPSDALGLVVDYLLGDRELEGPLARTVATSHLLDRVAAAHGIEVHETPVGFHHLGKLLSDGNATLAAEAGGALGLASHAPDKDGILACLLVAEMTARRGRPLRDQLADLHARVGFSTHRHHDYPLSAAQRERVERFLDEPPDTLGGRQVRRVVAVDGIKLHFDDSWFLYRCSSTEPVLRCTVEAPGPTPARALHEDGRRLLLGSRGGG